MSVIVGVTSRQVSVDRAIRAVRSPAVGGIAVFIGTVRGTSTDSRRLTSLELEAAQDLATADLERIANAAARKHKVSSICVRHRIGRLRVGDVIVVIAVGAPHRKDAFAACRFIIDELKKTTPIWKKERGPGFERWVEPER